MQRDVVLDRIASACGADVAQQIAEAEAEVRSPAPQGPGTEADAGTFPTRQVIRDIRRLLALALLRGGWMPEERRLLQELEQRYGHDTRKLFT